MTLPAEEPGTRHEPPGNRRPRGMITLDRIRLIGLLRKPLQMQGFLFWRASPVHHALPGQARDSQGATAGLLFMWNPWPASSSPAADLTVRCFLGMSSHLKLVYLTSMTERKPHSASRQYELIVCRAEARVETARARARCGQSPALPAG